MVQIDHKHIRDKSPKWVRIRGSRSYASVYVAVAGGAGIRRLGRSARIEFFKDRRGDRLDLDSQRLGHGVGAVCFTGL